MTVLLAIGLTFFMLSRTQVKTATNVENTVRADLLDNAATTLAVSFLKHDALVHPTYTSLDHAWRTYFNGACFVGKEWAFANPTGFCNPNKEIPTIFYTNEYAAGPGPYDNGMRQNIYIPRVEWAAQGEWLVPGDYSDAVNPFVVDPAVMTPAERVAQWADVDNDEDGLADSIWLPIAADVLHGGIDYDGDKFPDIPGDNVDNDLDDPDRLNPDELDEIAPFLYYGGNDGLDNDGLNGPDDPAEDRWFLTAPITMYANMNATEKIYVTLQNVALPSGVTDINTSPSLSWPQRWVDRIDNDYDLVINKHTEFYTYPDQPDFHDYARNIYTQYEFDNVLVGLHEIAPAYLPADNNGDAVRIKSTGEPVCELIGRAAILITDEASRVNLNVAGGQTLDVPEVATTVNDGAPLHRTIEPEDDDDLREVWTAALGAGVSTSEYATELLPEVGVHRALYLWHLLTGAPNGFASFDNGNQVRIAADYVPDVLLPGYGFVDDNGNALRLATNGIDDDGDGMVDEGVNPDYPALLGYFEGVDEPQELAQVPLRNLIAEKDGADNNENDITDEMGELSDRVLRTKEEIKRVALHQGEGPATSLYKQLRNFVTLNSAEIGKSYQQAATTGIGAATDVTGSESQPIEIKPDLSLADPEQIAEILRRNWGFEPIVFDNSQTVAIQFYAGLQQEAVTWVNCPFLDTADNPQRVFAADPYLRALQLGANINDFRDKDYVRSETLTLRDDPWWATMQQDAGVAAADVQRRAIQHTVAGAEGIRITEMMVRPVRRVEAEMTTNQAYGVWWPNKFSAFSVDDFYMVSEAMDMAIPSADYNLLDDPDFPLAATESRWRTPLETIGDRAVWCTPRRYVHVHPDGEPPSTTVVFPNILEFQFGPGPGLPPGRYYLTINTAMVDPNTNERYATVAAPNQMLIATKYVSGSGTDLSGSTPVSVGTTGIRDDVEAHFHSVYGALGFTPAAIRAALRDLELAWTQPIVKTRQEVTPGALDSSQILERVFVPTGDNTLPGQDPAGYGQDFFEPDHVGNPGVGYGTFMVMIPPYPASPTDDQVYLHVAVCMGPADPVLHFPSAVPELPPYDSDNIDNDGDGVIDDDDSSTYGAPESWDQLGDGLDNDLDGFIDDVPPTLAINFFDFSQEPDHEWVEIENVSGHEIDISGWELNVGAMDNVVGSIVSADGLKMRIPGPVPAALPETGVYATDDIDNDGDGVIDDTASDPAGMPEPSALATNGLDDDGDGVVDDVASHTTIPGGTENNRLILTPNLTDDATGIVTNPFFRNSISLAAGVPSVFDVWQATTPPIPPRDPGIPGVDRRGTPIGIDPFTDPALNDRIVQVQVDGLTTPPAILGNDSDRAHFLAEWVLRGGVFPNYPEHDGIDNDNDSMTLETDGIDNDSDGLIDEGVNTGDSLTDPEQIRQAYLYGLRRGWFAPVANEDDTSQTGPWAYSSYQRELGRSEGIDEGGYTPDQELPIPGAFDNQSVQYGSSFFMFNEDLLSPDGPAYLGNAAAPPDWKEFVERRFFPGDSVFVTLYQVDTIIDPDGAFRSVRMGVVDRVTYTERDVINRAIDDGEDVRHLGVQIRDSLFAPRGYGDFHYLTFWPDNTMGIDFYRTLERKHSPLYNGDRFGTKNRWEATDGNYDDWSHDPVKTDTLYDPTSLVLSPKWNGSPLSVNAAVLMDANRLIPTATPDAALADAIASSDQVSTPSVPLVSVGDLLRLPAISVTKAFAYFDNYVWGVTEYGRFESHEDSPGDATVNAVFEFVPGLSRELLSGRVLGQGQWPTTEWRDPSAPRPATQTAELWQAYDRQVEIDDGIRDSVRSQATVDRNAILSFGPISHASSPAISQSALMVAQADFHLLYPVSLPSDHSSATNWNDLLAWKDIASSTPLGYGPQAWRPVFLYPLGTEESSATYRYQYKLPDGGTLDLSGFVNTHFLFPNAPTLPNRENGTPWNEVLQSRWPIDQRAVMYVSRNLSGFGDPETPLHSPPDGNPVYYPGAAEALFVWTADDGVQDGKYNLYLDMGQYLVDVYRENPSLLTEDGRALARAALKYRPQDLQVDVEVYTDRNGNGKCWSGADNAPRIDTLEYTTSATVGDSLGRFDGLAADEEGYIAYGAGDGTPALVEIKNNYLAVRIRNWTPNGYGGLVRFAGVVLTPAKQTPGLININTVETRKFDDGGTRLLNPLMGLPGVLANGAGNVVAASLDPPIEWDPWLSLLQDTTGWSAQDEEQRLRLERARLIEVGRPKRADARYFASLSELVDDVGFLYRAPDNSEWPLFPLSTQSDLADRLDEVSWRFARLANLITTRSDVFEILVTVQAGYGVDASGDGRLNWRDNNEFIVTAEKKSRTVYER